MANWVKPSAFGIPGDPSTPRDHTPGSAWEGEAQSCSLARLLITPVSPIFLPPSARLEAVDLLSPCKNFYCLISLLGWHLPSPLLWGHSGGRSEGR